MKDAAIQILIYKPNPDSEDQRGVVVNPRLKQRFEQFVPIGVYLEGSDLKYYFFDQCDKAPKIYSSLNELKRDLPEGLGSIFEKEPKLFIMGHGNGGYYGLANFHSESEQLYDGDFDKLLFGFKEALPEHHGEYQVAVRKSLFASTQTAKELKINTIEYARAMLGKDASDEVIAKIALNRNILKIQDLKKWMVFQNYDLNEKMLQNLLNRKIKY